MSAKADPLRDPIKLSLEEFQEPHAGLAERVQKLDLLKKHHGVDNWMLLAYKLAVEHEPGFQIVIDDPLAAKMNQEWGLSLPVSGGVKGGRKGTGQIPELSGGRLVTFVRAIRSLFNLKSDSAACEHLVDTWINVNGPKMSRSERAALLATIKRRLAQAKERRGKAHQSDV
jgi:hypothetical protein